MYDFVQAALPHCGGIECRLPRFGSPGEGPEEGSRQPTDGF